GGALRRVGGLPSRAAGGAAAAARRAPGAPAALAQPAIKRGGTFVESINWTYPSLDSHLSSQPFMAGFEAMYNTLVRFELADPKTGEQKVVGDLAEYWEQPDTKTMVFKLRQGVTFHDGSSFDPQVAAWNMRRVPAPPPPHW